MSYYPEYPTRRKDEGRLKGSKGTTIVYANKLVVKDSETDNERAIPFLKRYTVFNGAP